VTFVNFGAARFLAAHDMRDDSEVSWEKKASLA